MKFTVSTSLESHDFKRMKKLVRADQSHDALILRKAILRGLPGMEQEILGPQFVGGKALKKKAA